MHLTQQCKSQAIKISIHVLLMLSEAKCYPELEGEVVHLTINKAADSKLLRSPNTTKSEGGFNHAFLPLYPITVPKNPIKEAFKWRAQ